MSRGVPTSMEARRRLEELHARIDDFFVRVASRYPGELACGRGCGACCQAGLSVTALEASLLREGLEGLNEEKRRGLARRAGKPGESCPALEPDGGCLLYRWRPLVCRTQGLPIRLRGEGTSELVACELNFTSRELDTVDGDCVLDQATLSTVLLALDAAYAAELGLPRGERFAMAELFRR